MGDAVTLTLILPWFPIILGVGVGGRLLGRTRGFALGLLCAFFWIVLVQASMGPRIWMDFWLAGGLLAGAISIFAMGGWAGETRGRNALAPSRVSAHESRETAYQADTASLHDVCWLLDQFDEWIQEHQRDGDPWPKFDEFTRSALYRCCRATHVKPYRLLNDEEVLVPLRECHPPDNVRQRSARRGIVGHVVTTGRAFIAGDATSGDLVRRLADESQEQIAWCFAITEGTRRVGVVVAGGLDIAPDRSAPLLRAVERLINRFWCSLSEVNRSRSATMEDPVSGLHTREAFLAVAEQSLIESYEQGEPVAVAVIGVEGLRELNDTGRWEASDELVRELCRSLRHKVRLDDWLGRFDGSRFIVLLRRVDSELASLIMAQLMSRLETICGDRARWRSAVTVRCGIAGSGTEQPSLRALVAHALSECRRARIEKTTIARDLGPVEDGSHLVR